MRNPDRLPGGYDICSEDGEIRWPEVKSETIQFAMIKASEWEREFCQDRCFLDHVREAYLHGLRVGAYHWFFADSVEEARLQADAFVSLIREAGVMINFYCGLVVTEWTDPDAMYLYIDIWMGIVRAAGYKPVLYAPQELLLSFVRLDMDLWTSCSPVFYGSLPAVIRDHTVLWQYKNCTPKGIGHEIARTALIRPAVLLETFNTSSVISFQEEPDAEELQIADWAIRLGIWRSDAPFNIKEEINREELMIMLRRFYDAWNAAHR